MTRAALTRLTLTDFRSYARAELPLDGRAVYLFGSNGAGKTNLLEAVSLLTAGRGLRAVRAPFGGCFGFGVAQVDPTLLVFWLLGDWNVDAVHKRVAHTLQLFPHVL